MRILSSVLVLCVFGITGANAAPSVRMLGSSAARVGTNTTVVKSDNNSNANASAARLGTIRSKAASLSAPITTKKVTTPTTAAGSASNARLSLGKYIHSTGVSAGTIKTDTNSTPGVASSDFVALSDQVKDLESSLEKGYYTRSEVNDMLEDIALGDMSGVLSDYATVEALNSKVDASALDSYATKEALDAKVDSSVLSAYATTSALDAKADATALNDYLTTASASETYQPIGDYATTEALSAKADASALSAYATTESLGSYYTKDEVDSKVAGIVAGDMNEALTHKQDTISDLENIRSGATAGAAALQALDNYATTSALEAKADASALDSYATKEALNEKADAAALSAYATTSALEAKADASALDSYATKEALNEKADASALSAYATTEALNSKADASALEGYLTTSSAATTYQPIGDYVSNPNLPSDSGDFMLVVNRNENGEYTYSWQSVSTSGGSSSGSESGGGSGWGMDDSDW